MARTNWMRWTGMLLCSLVAPPLAGGRLPVLSPQDVTVVGGQWTWASGSDRSPEWERYGDYGTKGVAAPGNQPGARLGSVSWTDLGGNLWLFGGESYPAPRVRHNDLWKWDGTNWTWMSGSKGASQPGTYGTKGVAAPGNVPGARDGAVSWTDAGGSLWLFGGIGYAASGSGALNDLWKWDGTSWTWVSGSDGVGQQGTYGTKGVAAPGNVPGARGGAVTWTDAGGDFWLFGGSGYAASGSGTLNDLWKWDGTSWTWVSGSSEAEQNGIYGTKGVAAPGNVPGGRYQSVSWTGADGSLWLFGGAGRTAVSFGYLNDLWKWDGTNWTWVSGSDVERHGTYGTKGMAGPGNVPGSRIEAVSWTDGNGSFWLFGGYGRAAAAGGDLNDLWRWDGTNWTWMSGSDAPAQPGAYGTKGLAAPGNVPGARFSSVSSRDASGNLWLFGGYGESARGAEYLSDLWKWDGTSWTWMSGWNGVPQYGTYGTKGVASPENEPGGRNGAVSWQDPSGGLWLSGGDGHAAGSEGLLNDLWKWDGTNWTWVSGSSSANQPGTYGTKGVTAPGNVPGGRRGSVSWRDASGNLWLFGGEEWIDPQGEGLWVLNDLWKWDGTTWTWVSGSNEVSQTGTYGTKGVAAPGNAPGARKDAVSWTDAVGNLWLFGGLGIAASDSGYLNDLWRWDGTNWTWVGGSNAAGEAGTYGAKGSAALASAPGARYGSVSWTDAAGSLWLFGGVGLAASGNGYLNDLWKWDGASWTWVSGSNVPNQAGIYGTKGVAAHGNEPGARYESVSWTDSSGNLWLLGGHGFSATGEGFLNDLWKWDGTSWTWVSGSNEAGESGTYGTKGSAVPGNVPGARSSSVSWTDGSGNLWLFGGSGVDSGGVAGSLNDLWAFGAECGYLAPPTAGNGGPYGVGATITLTASAIPGATFFWAGPNGFTSIGQSPTIPNATTAMAGSYSVTATVDGCTSWGTTTVIVLAPQTLTVTKVGTGGGLVVSSPSGIDCGGSCTTSVPAFSPVTLTATPDASSRFAGWAGEGCQGTDPCTVTMDGPKSVSAMFLPSGGVGFHTVTPCRIVDTRNAAGPFGGPPLEAGTARAFGIAGQCGVPADASAVALNVTITNPTSAGSLTIYPGTGVEPGTSTLFFAAGRTRANNATIGLLDGLLTVADHQATGTTELIIDVSGYYR